MRLTIILLATIILFISLSSPETNSTTSNSNSTTKSSKSKSKKKSNGTLFRQFKFGAGKSSSNCCDESGCGSDWTLGSKQCYKILDEDYLYTWEQAKAMCKKQESILIQIQNSNEQQALENFLFQQNCVSDNIWLGLQLKNGKAQKWDDGTAVGSYTNWDSGSPSGTSGCTCGEINTDGSEGKWADLSCEKKNMVVCQKAPGMTMSAIQKKLKELEAKLNKCCSGAAQQPAIPVGFTYMQLGKGKSPQEMWPKHTWQDISEMYANLFFRVTGKQTSGFGCIQPESAPRLMRIERAQQQYRKGVCLRDLRAHGTDVPASGWTSWTMSTDIPETDLNKATYCDALRFQMSGGEVRPRNMAMRVWLRTK